MQAYLAGRCQAISTDTSALYSVRAQQARPSDHVILPETISKEPLGPSVRQGDAQWFTIVKWVHFALLVAEELGVTQDNVDQMHDSPNPDIRLLLGTEGDFGKGLGLDKDFAARVIKAVGNYGEIFERNAGSGFSRLKIARGLNNLWNRAACSTRRLSDSSPDPPLRRRRAAPHRNFDTRSASSRMSLALSAAGVPMGSPL